MVVAKKTQRTQSKTLARFLSAWNYFASAFRIPAAPYVVTIFLSVSGWAFVYLLESLVAAPIVEYGVSWKVRTGSRVVTIRIENISRTNRIKDLRFGLASRVSSPGRFSKPGLYAVAPAAEGRESMARITGGGYEVQFKIEDMQPRQQFRLWVFYDGSDTPELRLLEADSPVYLYETGLITCLAKNVLPLVGLIAIASLLVLVFSIAIQIRSKNSAKSDFVRRSR